MPYFRWKMTREDVLDYQKEEMDRPSPEGIRAYLRGFKHKRKKPMFVDELKDLEIVYKSSLDSIQREVEETLPSLLHYMEKFLELHKQNEAIAEKLEILNAKTGKNSEDEEGDDE